MFENLPRGCLVAAVDTEINFRNLQRLPVDTIKQYFHAIKVHPLNSIFLNAVTWTHENGHRLFIDAKLCDIPESIVRFVSHLSRYQPHYLTILYNGTGTENSIEAAKLECDKYGIIPVCVIKLTSSSLIDVSEIIKSVEVLKSCGIKHFVVPLVTVYNLREYSDLTLFTPGIKNVSEFSLIHTGPHYIISGRVLFDILSV